jgi:hypothetical protein
MRAPHHAGAHPLRRRISAEPAWCRLRSSDFQSAARYRGHAMRNFNLTTLNEKDVVSGIQEMAKLN